MRRVRAIICITFVISCIVFVGYAIKKHLVEDNNPPVITCEKDEISVSVADDSELMKGIKAKDNRDGEISKSICISSMSHFISEGRRTVEYIVFDKANNVAKVERTITYTDYKSPRIHLLKPLRFTMDELGKMNTLKDVTAEDCLDGDLSKQVRCTIINTDYGVDIETQDVVLQVSNSAGDVCKVPVQMQIVNQNDRSENSKMYPMLSEYIVYTTVNEALDLNSYLIGVIQGKTEYSFANDSDYLEFGAESISITSYVDYATPGVYTVEYSCSAYGQPAVTKLYVVVEE